MRSFLFAAVAMSAVTLTTCQKGEALPPVSRTDLGEPIPFVAPPDSGISVEQMRSWNLCNHFLDSLSQVYRDSFATDEPSRRSKYEQDFVSAQDVVCVRQGLKGGYEEYLWIMQALAHPRNKMLRDSFGIVVH